ncbi:MAG TPA: translation elongation factor Ts [Thermoanaerobaculia bacterium]|nr:translation elongation factor Ts [Thermoanaerobaculia bacterium]
MAEITAAQVKELREKTGAGMMDCKKALTEAGGDFEEAVKVLRKKGLAAAGRKAGRVTSEGLAWAEVSEGSAVAVEINSETDFVAQNAEFRELVVTIAGIAARSKAGSVDQLVDEKWPGDPENRTVAQILAEKIAKIGENLSVRRFIRYEATPKSVFGTYVHGNGRIAVVVELHAEGGDRDALGSLARDLAMHVAAAEPRFLRREEITEADLTTEREIARDQALKSGKPENVVEKIVSGKMEKFYGEAVLLEQPYIREEKTSIRQLVEQRAGQAGAKAELARFARFKVGEGLERRSDDFVAEVMAQARG